jgi:hypothetical protein
VSVCVCVGLKQNVIMSYDLLNCVCVWMCVCIFGALVRELNARGCGYGCGCGCGFDLLRNACGKVFLTDDAFRFGALRLNDYRVRQDAMR